MSNQTPNQPTSTTQHTSTATDDVVMDVTSSPISAMGNPATAASTMPFSVPFYSNSHTEDQIANALDLQRLSSHMQRYTSQTPPMSEVVTSRKRHRSRTDNATTASSTSAPTSSSASIAESLPSSSSSSSELASDTKKLKLTPLSSSSASSIASSFSPTAAQRRLISSAPSSTIYPASSPVPLPSPTSSSASSSASVATSKYHEKKHHTSSIQAKFSYLCSMFDLDDPTNHEGILQFMIEKIQSYQTQSWQIHGFPLLSTCTNLDAIPCAYLSLEGKFADANRRFIDLFAYTGTGTYGEPKMKGGLTSRPATPSLSLHHLLSNAFGSSNTFTAPPPLTEKELMELNAIRKHSFLSLSSPFDVPKLARILTALLQNDLTTPLIERGLTLHNFAGHPLVDKVTCVFSGLRDKSKVLKLLFIQVIPEVIVSTATSTDLSTSLSLLQQQHSAGPGGSLHHLVSPTVASSAAAQAAAASYAAFNLPQPSVHNPPLSAPLGPAFPSVPAHHAHAYLQHARQLQNASRPYGFLPTSGAVQQTGMSPSAAVNMLQSPSQQQPQQPPPSPLQQQTFDFLAATQQQQQQQALLYHQQLAQQQQQVQQQAQQQQQSAEDMAAWVAKQQAALSVTSQVLIAASTAANNAAARTLQMQAELRLQQQQQWQQVNATAIMQSQHQPSHQPQQQQQSHLTRELSPRSILGSISHTSPSASTAAPVSTMPLPSSSTITSPQSAFSKIKTEVEGGAGAGGLGIVAPGAAGSLVSLLSIPAVSAFSAPSSLDPSIPASSTIQSSSSLPGVPGAERPFGSPDTLNPPSSSSDSSVSSASTPSTPPSGPVAQSAVREDEGSRARGSSQTAPLSENIIGDPNPLPEQ